MLIRIGILLSTFLLLAVLFVNKPRSQAMATRQSLRLVIVSDTHRIYRQPIPKGDVLIHCGDSEWSPKELEHWASKQSHTHVLAVSGNMDYRLQDAEDSLKRVTYLQDSLVDISGIKIWGSPWTPRFVGVFQLYSDREANAVWEKMPSEVDVLITHGPPKGIRDVTSRGKSVGDTVLGKKVQEVKPRVHCFGHIHESYGTHKTEDTLFCNGAVFNGHPAIVVDVPFDKSKPAELV